MVMQDVRRQMCSVHAHKFPTQIQFQHWKHVYWAEFKVLEEVSLFTWPSVALCA